MSAEGDDTIPQEEVEVVEVSGDAPAGMELK